MRKKWFNQAESDIAITGIALRLPGTSSLDEFWQHLVEQRCFISDFPADRLSPEEIQAYSTKYQLKNKLVGSFLPDIDSFDAPFFSITRREAELMDPHQRMALELSWQALEDAAYQPSTLAGKNVGVYMGICNADYLGLIEANRTDRDPYIPTGTGYSIVANRVSYFFDFRGPSVVNDAACASSLVSLHQAVQALRNENLSVALAGAVNICSSANRFIEFSQSGMLSKSGRCKAFDAQADGYVRGEGGVVLVLKPLEQALADNDRIHGLIKGTAINHGGKTGSLTITNPDAQSDVINSALQDAKVEAGSVTYIEAHGPGTPLGDPIEIVGIENAYFKTLQNKTKKNNHKKSQWRCGIGSVKTNFGHLEAAAGLLGLLKVVAAMQHKSLPASANFNEINPIIEIDHTPLFVVDKNCAWNAPEMSGIKDCPRRAGISSFGMGGVNTHVIIEEFDYSHPSNAVRTGDKLQAPANNVAFVPLSAKTPHQLLSQASNLLHFLETTVLGDEAIHRIAYTLQAGREAFKHRLVFWVDSIATLIRQLKLFSTSSAFDGNKQFVQGSFDDQQASQPVLQGDDLASLRTANHQNQNQYQQLLAQWVKGRDINWHCLQNGVVELRPLSLPTYPFDKKTYWITKNTETVVRQATVIHPLLHINTSTLQQQNYRSSFNGSEFFLNDHRVQGEKILPGVAYLEMARVAIIDAAAMDNTEILELHNIVWARPFLVSEEKKIDIRLMPIDDKRLDFEVYSQENGQELTHCQGKARFIDKQQPTKVHGKLFSEEIDHNKLSANTVYAAFNKMGIQYGPAHRGLVELWQQPAEVIAKLTLPNTVAPSISNYSLHPSMLDCALQANIGLTVNWQNIPDQPPLPFALESITIFSACTQDMTARLRYSANSSTMPAPTTGSTVRLDIDLYDQAGNTCAQMRGFSLRTLKQAFSESVGKTKISSQLTSDILTGANKPANDEEFDEAFYSQVITRIVNKELSVAEAVELE